MSAFDDFPPATHLTLPQWGRHKAMLEEIDALRLKLAWTEQIAQDRGEENERLRAVVFAALAWADAEDETLTTDLQDSTDALWSAVEAFRAPCGPDCELDSTGIVHRPSCISIRWEP